MARLDTDKTARNGRWCGLILLTADVSLGVADRMLDVPVAEISLDRPGVLASIRQRVAGGVA